MKKLILIAAVLLLLISCRSNKPAIMPPVVLNNLDSTSLETKYVQIPADSAWFYAYFKCDSNNRVIMASVLNGSTNGLEHNFSFNNGVLNVKTLKPVDSISYQYIVRVISRSVPVPQPYAVEKELTKWQNFRMTLGSLFMGILAIALLYSGFRIYRKFI